VRELRNAVERAVVLSAGDTIGRDDLRLDSGQKSIQLDPSISGYHDQVRALKRRIIQEALDASDGVQRLAAERLGIQRSYLSRLMKNLEMR
jgi:Nif-specific regulatory protein